MKIRRVSANNRRKAFEIETARGPFAFPYGLADPPPCTGNGVVDVERDPELGHEAFTYRLQSGEEGTVHVDAVLEYNQDPEALADLIAHRLSVEAHRGIERSNLSRQELVRRLDTSPSQLHRLLDEGNTRKSLYQLLVLLHVLGLEVSVDVHRRTGR